MLELNKSKTKSNDSATSKILWVTNNAAPYRRPLWASIGSETPLDVALLQSDVQLVKDGRRGSEWRADSAPDVRSYRLRSLRTISFGRGERVYFVLTENGRKLVRASTVVLLGGWESPAYWQLLFSATVRRKRKVGFYESTLATSHYLNGPIGAARSWFFRRLDAVVVPGDAAEEAVLAMGVDPRRIFKGFNSIDVQAFADGGDRPRRSSIGHRYVYVGQLIDRKNVDAIVCAFAAIREPGDTLTIIGSGERLSALKAIVASEGVGESVEFLGEVTYSVLPTVLSGMDTIVLASKEEVWGLVVNEALAAGCHAVVSSNAGVAASVKSMQGVFLVSPTKSGIEEGLRASRLEWSGPVESPQILKMTPHRFAEVFLHAMDLV